MLLFLRFWGYNYNMKKEQKEKIDEKEKKKNEKRLEKQTAIAIFIMIAVIVAVIIFYVFNSQLKNFKYEGIKIEKGKLGEQIFYLAYFPITDDIGNIVDFIKVYLRQDPRTLEYITVNSGDIRLKKNTALAATSEFVENCSDSLVAATTLSGFLQRAGLVTFPATTNKTEAEEKNRIFVTCQNTTSNSIIIFEKGSESSIVQQGDCYRIIAGKENCDILNVTEKFMFGVYASNRAES